MQQQSTKTQKHKPNQNPSQEKEKSARKSASQPERRKKKWTSQHIYNRTYHTPGIFHPIQSIKINQILAGG
jgi:hypothetical protein